MGVEKETQVNGTGKDQLGNEVGKPQKGDIVHVHYRGYYMKNGKKKVEFEDTYHQVKMKTFRIGSNQTMPGLEAGVMDMTLGEEARIMLTADVAYGEEGYQGFVAKVPPNVDVVLEKVALVKIARGQTVHNRVQPKDDSSCIDSICYLCCRGY